MAPRYGRALVWLGVFIYFVQLASMIYSVTWHFGRPLGGFMPHLRYPLDMLLLAAPTNAEAARYRAQTGWTVELIAVNGQSVCEADDAGRCGVDWARSLIDTTPGAINRFEVRGSPGGPVRELELVAGPSEFAALMSWNWQGLLLAALGLVYVLVGLFVWRKRPADPAALPLLLFSLATASLLSPVLDIDSWTRSISSLSLFTGPALMPLIFLLGDSFAMQSDTSKTLRFRLQLYVGLAVGFGEACSHQALLRGATSMRPVVRLYPSLMVAGAIVALSLTLKTLWKAARPPSPLAHRRRARVFALAIAIGFAYPTLWLLSQRWVYRYGLEAEAFVGVILSFVGFPLVIGYAIVKHRMFDLRIVVRQGLIYAILSSGLALAYLALVFGAYRLIGVDRSPLVAAASVVVVALLAGVARLRLERLIDRFVFRGRAVFRRAIEVAGHGLSRAQRSSDIAAALKPALVDALGLSRAYVADLEPGDDRVCCHLVATSEDLESGEVPELLPDSVTSSHFASIGHAIATAAPVHAFDPAVPAEADGSSFWDRFGIEAIIPFGVAQDRPRGLLMLGPKHNGRPFDPEDTALVNVLGSQVALSLENTSAFERIAEQNRAILKLTQGIVHEANSPLGALSSSLDTLKRAFEKVTRAKDPEKREAIARSGLVLAQAAQNSGRRLELLIDGLKDYVNLEETDRHPMDLLPCLREAVRDVQRDSSHEISIETSEPAAWVMGYPTKLRHVFANLLRNGVAATPGDAPVRACVVRDGGHVVVTVRDAGTGIPADVVRTLFDFGLSSKRSQNRVGLRIGLPYAKRVVESLEGQLGIRSELGKGTEVRIRLRALAAEHEVAPRPAAELERSS